MTWHLCLMSTKEQFAHTNFCRGVAMGMAKMSVGHLGVHLDVHPVEAVVELSVPAV